MQCKQFNGTALLAEATIFLTMLCSAGALRAATGTLPPPTTTHYHFITVDPPGGQLGSLNINNRGVATSAFADAANAIHGFVWQDGAGMVIDEPGMVNTALNGLNDAGKVVGWDDLGPIIYDLQHRTWEHLPSKPELPNSFGGAINNRGIILGGAWTDTGSIGWIWDGNSYSLFRVPEASQMPGLATLPQDINDHNQVVGTYWDAQGVSHGFVKSSSGIVTFDVPGADGTAGIGINNRGEITGFYYNLLPDSYTANGYILRNGRFVTVNILGSTICGMTRINDHGELSGIYVDTLGNSHGFVGIPEGGSNAD